MAYLWLIVVSLFLFSSACSRPGVGEGRKERIPARDIKADAVIIKPRTVRFCNHGGISRCNSQRMIFNGRGLSALPFYRLGLGAADIANAKTPAFTVGLERKRSGLHPTYIADEFGQMCRVTAGLSSEDRAQRILLIGIGL